MVVAPAYRGAVNNTFYRPRSGFRTGIILRRFPSSTGDLSVKIWPKQKKRTRHTAAPRGCRALLIAREWQFPRLAQASPRAPGRGIRSPVRLPYLRLRYPLQLTTWRNVVPVRCSGWSLQGRIEWGRLSSSSFFSFYFFSAKIRIIFVDCAPLSLKFEYFTASDPLNGWFNRSRYVRCSSDAIPEDSDISRYVAFFIDNKIIFAFKIQHVYSVNFMFI